MTNSYLILDEAMRFLNCEDGGKTPSESLLGMTFVLSSGDYQVWTCPARARQV